MNQEDHATNWVLLSVDMDGITGIVSADFVDRRRMRYPVGQAYAHHDVNAVIEGILDAAPQMEVVVRDAHGDAQNLDLRQLHPRARLVQGWGRAVEMAIPLDTSCKGVLLVGYHAGGHDSGAVLAHTFLDTILDVLVNGVRFTEAGIVALAAAAHSVPIAFLSGDDHAVREAAGLGEAIVMVEVKKSLARDSALSLPLAESARLLRAGAAEATRRVLTGACRPLTIESPPSVEIRFSGRGYWPTPFDKVERLLSCEPAFDFDPANLTVRFTSPTVAHAYARIRLVIELAIASSNRWGGG